MMRHSLGWVLRVDALFEKAHVHRGAEVHFDRLFEEMAGVAVEQPHIVLELGNQEVGQVIQWLVDLESLCRW